MALRNVAGPHVQVLTDDSRRLFRQQSGSIKVCHPAFSMDLLREFHDINPTAPIGLRLIDDSADLNNIINKQAEACRLFSPALSYIPSEYLWLEVVINEKYVAGTELQRLADKTIDAALLISDAGFRPIGFNIPTGNIARIAGTVVQGLTYTSENSELRYIYSAVEVLNGLRGAIGYHNYTVPWRALDTWYDLRYERMAAELPDNTNWWLGEGMFDRGIIDGILRGWRDEMFHQSAEDVARYTRAFARHASVSPRVIAWTPFGAGPTQDWASFQYDNERVITSIFTEKYPMDEIPVIGAGFRRMIKYLGQPLEDEVYHFPGTPMENSLAVYENGKATWSRATNATIGERYSDGAIFTDKGNAGDGSTVWQLR